jgi:hypothetical protein
MLPPCLFNQPVCLVIITIIINVAAVIIKGVVIVGIHSIVCGTKLRISCLCNLLHFSATSSSLHRFVDSNALAVLLRHFRCNL